jgi:hypothetical protein
VIAVTGANGYVGGRILAPARAGDGSDAAREHTAAVDACARRRVRRAGVTTAFAAVALERS